MDYTTNFSMKLPKRGVDMVKVDDLNDNTEDIDTLIHQNRTMIAPAFDSTKAYVIGDPVVYLGELFVFIADKAAGAWDATKVEPTTAAEMGGGGTEVVANPSGTATAELTKIDIGGTKYNTNDATARMQLNAMKTGFDGVTYSNPAAMVQGCDNKVLNMSLSSYGTEITTSNYSTDLPDLNSALPNTIYNIYSCANLISHCPSVAQTYKHATVWTIIDNVANDTINWRVQFYCQGNASENGLFYRNAFNGSWSAWVKLVGYNQLPVVANITRVTSSNYSTVLPSFDSANKNCIYNIYNCISSITNYPVALTYNSGTLVVLNGQSDTDNWTIQLLASQVNNVPVIFSRFCMNNNWTMWVKLMNSNDPTDLGTSRYFVSTTIDRDAIPQIDENTHVLAFGDSIMSGVGVDHPWLYYLSQKTGCAFTNKAVGGAEFGESVSTSNYWISTQIAGATETNWSDATLIIIGAGTNDAGDNTPHDELKAKVQSAITSIKAKTNAPILFITPIRRGTSPADANLQKLPLISGIISNVALSNECSVINGFDFPIPTYNVDQIADLTQDHLHPNETGTKVYAQKVLSILN